MSDTSSLGDRMKLYEGMASGQLMPLLPAIARLDGKAFHSFTRGLKRPYDPRLSDLMVRTTAYLVEETNARTGYTQSDEITLVWQAERFDSELYFAGKVLKMTSVLAASATAFFNRHLPAAIPEKASAVPLFDCRVWSVPNRVEAVNCLVWREQDATRNSISMAAQSLYSHKALHGKDCGEMQEMLFQKGVNWNDYPASFKRGTYVQRKTVEKPFTAEELDKLPPKHEARRNPGLVVSRREVRPVDMPPLLRVSNRVEVVFDGAGPLAGVTGAAVNECACGES